MTHHGSHDAELIYNFSELLDPAAGPWKLEVEFTQQSGFAEDQLVKFSHVPFPVIGETNQAGLVSTALGNTITIDSVYRESVNGPVKIFAPGEPIIEVAAPDALQLHLVSAISDQGNTLRTAVQTSLGKGRYGFALQSGQTAQSMDLTFAVHTRRQVEFTAMPVLAATNGASATKP